jgi:hypothetical protein
MQSAGIQVPEWFFLGECELLRLLAEGGRGTESNPIKLLLASFSPRGPIVTSIMGKDI